ncbi:unnamed protein product, partial [Mesorhabditis belari]|uniref:Uncharacterized protein n=1 Tax=Mesorhabditis belari TaxID=2138241 RepID=A0AAF3FMW6_9BILA
MAENNISTRLRRSLVNRVKKEIREPATTSEEEIEEPEEPEFGKKRRKTNAAGKPGANKDPDFHPTATAEISIKGNREIKKLLDDFNKMGQSKKVTARYQTSVASRLIPGKSSRVSILKGGTLRFKFRKLEVTETVPNKADLQRYERVIWEAQKRWIEKMASQEFCAALKNFTSTQWTPSSECDFVAMLKTKKSIGIRHGAITTAVKDNVDLLSSGAVLYDLPISELPDNLEQITFGKHTFVDFKSGSRKKEITSSDWTSIAYTGGPINSLDFAPVQRKDGSDILALSVFPEDSTLTGKGRTWIKQTGYFQLWMLTRPTEGMTIPTLCGIVRIPDEGLVLKVKWCAKPCEVPKKDDDPIGYLAVAMASGKILIYKISDVLFNNCDAEAVPVFEPSPDFVLRQENNPEYMTGENPLGYPPIISVDWAHFAGGDRIAAVNAAGNILIWELSNEEFTTEDGILPIEMSSESWNSPAVDVVWNSEKAVAVSFREGLLRLLDTDTGECLLEEATIRTAGQRCSAQLRLFPGVFLLQVVTSDSSNGGTCYLIPDRQNKGYFVVPLSNKHDICIWSISTCAINGVVSSCGVDGAVLMSINGRIAPNNATVDFTFSAQRKALQLTRFRVNLAPPTDDVAPPVHDTHELAQKYMWLEVNVSECDRIPVRRNIHSCGDLRLESLNCMATSYGENPIAVSGGQAGLLFVLPCRV